MSADPLEPILAQTGSDSHLLHRAELQAISGVISRYDPDEFIDAVALVCGLTWDDGQTRPPGYLEMHGQRCWIDVSDPEKRRKLLTVIAATALVDALGISLSTSWVAQVLTTAVNIDSVATTDAGVLIRLRGLPTPQLPPDLQNVINHADYASFVETIAAAMANTEQLFTGGTISFNVP